MHPGEDKEGQYQFGGVAKADVEQPAERLSACSASGGAAKPICEDRDGGGTNKEDPPAGASARRKCNVEQGMRDKQQQGVGDHRN